MRRSFKHKNFVWLGNTLGKNDTIYPPFEPIRVKDREAEVVLRTYAVNGFGLWDSVKSEGREILAGPIVLRVQTETGEQRWQFDNGRWTTVQPHRAVFETQAIAPAVKVHTRSTLEYDGCMKVEMDLLPGQAGQTVQRLWLEIPLKDKEAPLFHYAAFESMRRNYAGRTPRRAAGLTWMSQPYDKDPPPWPMGALPPVWKAEPGSDDGVLWTCRDIRPWKRVIQSDFVPYIWLGGGSAGWPSSAPTTRAICSTPKAAYRPSSRRGDTLYLRVDLVNKPLVIAEPRHIVFGLQASPTRPMPQDWRERHKVTPGMPGPVGCWGGYLCANKYPEGYHFNVVDEICKVRETGVVDRSIFEKMDAERAELWKRPWGGTGAPGFDTWLDRDFWWFVNQAKGLHDRSDWRRIAAEGVYSKRRPRSWPIPRGSLTPRSTPPMSPSPSGRSFRMSGGRIGPGRSPAMRLPASSSLRTTSLMATKPFRIVTWISVSTTTTSGSSAASACTSTIRCLTQCTTPCFLMPIVMQTAESSRPVPSGRPARTTNASGS